MNNVIILFVIMINCVYCAEVVVVDCCIDPKTGRAYAGFKVTDAELSNSLALMLKDAPELTMEEYFVKCAERVVARNTKFGPPSGFTVKMGVQKFKIINFDLVDRVSFDGQTERKIDVDKCNGILLKLVKMGKEANAYRKPLALPPIGP